MGTPSTERKHGLLHGVEDLIKAALPAPTGYGTKTTTIALSRQKQSFPDLTTLVENLWRQIVVNWVEGGRRSSGKENWRWGLRTNGGKGKNQAEVSLQRKIACLLMEAEQGDYWSNETPTGSGLSKSGGNTGAIDLARKESENGVVLIELKAKIRNKNTPVSAAFQIVLYGLVLALARLAKDKIRIVSRVWRDAKRAKLIVLAPHSFYSEFLGLGWFEKSLDIAVREFGAAHDLPMSFAFREFNPEFDAVKHEPPSVRELIERLGERGKIPWK